MKKGLLFCALVCISLTTFSQGCPITFRRNNGNGGGCPGGKMVMGWTNCPTPIPTIDSIKVAGIKINVVIGAGICVSNKVEYCVIGGNIPTAGVVEAYFSFGTPGTAWSCFVPEAGPLPIQLSSFYAQRNNSAVALNWKTASEINAKAFVIERKTAAGFEAVATIAATNNANGSAYSYTDNNNSKTVSEYRIRMVDIDGSFKYSEIRSVKGSGAVSDFTVFPNPSTGDAKVSVTDVNEATDVQLIDNAGRIVKNISMSGNNAIQLNNLQKGMYMIRIVNKNSGESLTKKLTVIN